MIFIDTNYFLRFLLNDINKQHKEAKSLFLKAAKGQLKLVTSLIVIFEIYWVLRSVYRQEKTTIVNLLEKVIGMSFIELNERVLLQEALSLFRKNQSLSLADCYNFAFAKNEGVKEFRTFDRKLDKAFDQNK